MTDPGASAALRGRLDWLTALRFFAAFGVLMCHLVSPFHITGVERELLLFGQFGVDFFFVLSGFVLTWSRKPGRSAWRFYWLRFARVWPLHAAVIIVLLVLGVRSSWRDTILQILLLQQWNPGAVWTEGINGVSWTLSVEAFFYALFPALLPMLARMKGRGLAVIVGGLWVAHLALILLSHGWAEPLKDWATFSNPAVRVPQFMAGIAVALTVERTDLSRYRPAALRSIEAVALAALTVCWAAYALAGGGHIAFWTWALTPVMSLVIGAVAAAGVSLQSTTPRVLVTLGEWSFALYLVHRSLVYAHVFPHTTTWPAWLAALVAVALSLAVAGVAHECLEKPVERWLRARGPREPGRVS